MKKIPTIFLRDEKNRKYVTNEINPECQWVFDGEGVATRKFDGHGMMLDEDGRWWSRREVKRGKTPPPNYILVHYDATTGTKQGWEPIEQSGFVKFFNEAFVEPDDLYWIPGTYELCGPKVNGDPERFGRHFLIRHGVEKIPSPGEKLDPFEIKWWIKELSILGREGIVWHHPDGRMAKLKARDLR